MNTNSPTLCIVGGGQLGFLLCSAARELGITTVVVTNDADAPALGIADHSLVTTLDAPDLASTIADQSDVVTFEFEAVSDRLLAGLVEQERAGKIAVRPGVDVMTLIKSKIRQKQWYVDHDLPTLEFVATEAPREELESVIERSGLPFVQKAAGGGYDGYGGQVIRSRSDLDQVWDTPSIFEPCLADPTELAVVVARSTSGECVAYHPVEMVFDPVRNVLDNMVSPAMQNERVQADALALALEAVRQLDGVGVFAVEMFLRPDDGLVINEVSPRVHNSGHHTLDAYDHSQFEQHVRACCGLPLAPMNADVRPAVMVNLLFEDRLAPLMGLPAGPVQCVDEGVHLHWYGKLEARPGRKMGHITCLDKDLENGMRRIDLALDALTRNIDEAVA